MKKLFCLAMTFTSVGILACSNENSKSESPVETAEIGVPQEPVANKKISINLLESGRVRAVDGFSVSSDNGTLSISGQDVESKQKFAQDLGLDFSILADTGDEVRSAFGVPKAFLGLLPGRVTYVLDKQDVCIEVYDELKDAASHVQVAKESLAANAPTNKFAALFG